MLKRIISVCDDEIKEKIEKHEIMVGVIFIVECEFDLWWLLRRKQCEIYADGKVYFYEHDIRDVPSAKQMLLSAHGVESKYNKSSGRDDKFKEFYEQAFDDIRNKLPALNSGQIERSRKIGI